MNHIHHIQGRLYRYDIVPEFLSIVFQTINGTYEEAAERSKEIRNAIFAGELTEPYKVLYQSRSNNKWVDPIAEMRQEYNNREELIPTTQPHIGMRTRLLIYCFENHVYYRLYRMERLVNQCVTFLERWDRLSSPSIHIQDMINGIRAMPNGLQDISHAAFRLQQVVKYFREQVFRQVQAFKATWIKEVDTDFIVHQCLEALSVRLPEESIANDKMDKVARSLYENRIVNCTLSSTVRERDPYDAMKYMYDFAKFMNEYRSNQRRDQTADRGEPSDDSSN